MPESRPVPDAKPTPTLADRHWRATLRTRKREDLDNDMIQAIETDNAWRFGMLMQIDAGWGRNERVLRATIEHGRDKMFDTLTQKDSGWKNSVNITSLASEAAEAGRLNFVKLFVEKHGADIHYYNEEMLRKAVSNGHEEVVKYLVGKGADVKTWGNDPIMTAADKGHLGIVKILVEAGADVNSGYYGSGVLGKAVNSGNLALVEYLFDKGVDVKADHHAAFTNAAREGKIEMVQLFLDRKVKADVEDGEAFVAAIANKKFDVAELLLLNGASVDSQNGKALRHAAWQKEMATAEWLLQHRANPNAGDSRETALSEAVGGGSKEMVLLLMRHGADMMALQGEAWHKARSTKNKDMQRALVQGERDSRAFTRKKKTAEFEDTFGGKPYTLDDLRNTKGASGDTGLLIAAQTGKFADIIGKATGGKLTGDDLYHPDDRIDTVFSMLLRHKNLQDFFHPSFWADRPYEVKDVIAMLPERYQKRVNMGPIANELNFRELRKRAATSNMSLKPNNPKPPAPKLPGAP